MQVVLVFLLILTIPRGQLQDMDFHICKFYFNLCIGFFACMCVLHHVPVWGHQNPEDGVRSSGTGAVDGCHPPCGWELNPGLMEEQPVLFTAEPSLQPNAVIIFIEHGDEMKFFVILGRK